METWPQSLPQKLQLESFQESLIQNAVVSENDTGPEFRRVRYTMEIQPVSGSIIVDTDQLSTLKGFWSDDIHYGVDDFKWTGMIKDAVDYTIYIDAKEPPSIEPLGGGYWSVTMNIKIMKEA